MPKNKTDHALADAILISLLTEIRDLETAAAIVGAQLVDMARARGVLPPEAPVEKPRATRSRKAARVA
jgi:hypothetical protein